MTTRAEIEQTQEHLRDKREGDFAGQLAAYKELGRLWTREGAYEAAAENLEKAARVAEYLDQPAEVEAIFHSLIAIHERAGDLDEAINAYSLLQIHFNMMGDGKRANHYNEIRLGLVAQRIGKTSPSMDERFQYEFSQASRSLERNKARYRKLIEGQVDPTVPDEHVEACDFLVQQCLAEERYDEAMGYASACERAMQSLGAWASPDGIHHVLSLQQLVEQKRRETA